ncbi:MAG: NAD-dependent epimerase/dehydratase family protein [Armatimonadetes bacterium]|nr:NAD-dependent epimerase/dehydratase family protein [Armatimonadota bacterium]
MQKVLITGASGFIGMNLAKKFLQDNFEVHIIARTSSNLKLLNDIKNNLQIHLYDGTIHSLIHIFKKAKPKIVFHLASLFIAQHTVGDIDKLITSNILFGAQLIEAMLKNEVYYLINTGTSWQHYKNKNYSPVCLYAATKEAFDKILQFYIETTPLKVITLKLFDTYGPKDSRSKLINILKDNLKEQKLLKMSPGEQLIDLVYIDDVVNAFVLAGQKILKNNSKQMESFAISSGSPISLKKLIKLFENISGRKLYIKWGGRPYRDREVMLPWNTGKYLPGWSAKVSLKEGLSRFLK